jgi:hypothetical protein
LISVPVIGLSIFGIAIQVVAVHPPIVQATAKATVDIDGHRRICGLRLEPLFCFAAVSFHCKKAASTENRLARKCWAKP